jgi:DNA-directed RNA polymerase specialized sigma24 family protein
MQGRKEGRKEGRNDDPTDAATPFPTEAFPAGLAAWIARQVRDPGTVDDLTQESLLHAVLTARRHGVVDLRQCEKIAQAIARRRIAEHWRNRVRKPETNRTLDLLPRVEPGLASEWLSAMRASLEPRLGRQQRALLALWLDDGVTTVRGLAAVLRTSPANVRRMLEGMAKKIPALGPL